MTADSLDEYLKNSIELGGIKILGLENVNITDVDTFLSEVKENAGKLEYQIFDADTIMGKKHLVYAALNALNVFKHENNISRSLPVEIILYASGQRQIGKAFKTVGVKTQTKNLILLTLTEDENKAEEFVRHIQRITRSKINHNISENFNKKKFENVKKVFNISKREIETLKTSKTKIENIILDLIIERMALLTTY